MGVTPMYLGHFLPSQHHNAGFQHVEVVYDEAGHTPADLPYLNDMIWAHHMP